LARRFIWIAIFEHTFIAPVEQNAARVGELEDKIASLQTHLSEMDARLGAIESSIEGTHREHCEIGDNAGHA
jgi:hypothetical protein